MIMTKTVLLPIVLVRPQELGLTRGPDTADASRGVHGKESGPQGVSTTAELQRLPCLGWGAFHLPAVDYNGPGFRGVEELDLADEAQEAGGVAGDAMVGPAGKVEEAELPDLMVAFLRRERASVPPAAAPTQCPWEPGLLH